jgi:lipoate-protein ligase A
MYFYESTSTDPYENLALEEHLFETLPEGAGLFMLWQNTDAVIIGRYQNAAEEIDAAYVKENGIAVVRRMSGGGAVFHDLGGLNYTLITDDAESPVPTDGSADADAVWQACMAPLLAVLRGYGLDAQFTGRNDIEIGGKKIAGCAQYARGSRTLHHGCILFGTDLSKVAAALDPGEAKFISKSDKSVRARVTTIRACLDAMRTQLAQDRGEPAMPDIAAGIVPDMETFRRDLHSAYSAAEGGSLTPCVLTAADAAAVRRLQEEKYRTWEWNYGYRTDYQVHREQRFAAGLVAADMDVEGGRIRAVRFSGDFFADGDLTAFERSLAGLALDETLLAALRERGADAVIAGIGTEDLAALLTA